MAHCFSPHMSILLLLLLFFILYVSHFFTYMLCIPHTVSSRETREPTKPQTFFSPSHHQNISSKDNKNNRPSQIDNIHRSNLSHTSPQSSPVVGQLTPAAGAEDTTLHYLRVDREITFFALPNMMSCEFWSPCRE